MSTGPVPSIGILTDLEPDDLIAIAALPQADFYLVGEGDPKVKWARMKKYAGYLFKHPEESQVIAGAPSHRTYECEGDEFYDGLEVPVSPRTPLEGCPITSRQGTPLEYVLDALRALSQTRNAPTLIVMKPPHELVALFVSRHEEFCRVVENIDLLCYGGFNFRETPSIVHDRRLGKSETSTTLFDAFRSVRIYDRSLCTPEELALTGNAETIPKIQRVMEAGNEHTHLFWTATCAALSIWNREIEARLTDKTDMHSKRILAAVQSDPHQVVLADFVLSAIFHSRELQRQAQPINHMFFDAKGVLQYANVLGKPAKPWSVVLPVLPSQVDEILAPILARV